MAFFISKSISLPFCKNVSKLPSIILSSPMRHLYAKAALGLDTFALQQQQVKNHMANIAGTFKEKMKTFSNENSANMIFTEDLKNMIYLAGNDDDIALVVKMIKKFNQQNKTLRFGSFVFGPVVMRMFHTYNKPDIAMECFKAEELSGFFDHLITYQIFMDLLYENEKYNEMLEVSNIIKERQIEAIKYPRNVIVLTMAACYKLNSQEGFNFASNLWKELREAGHAPMRRAATFFAGLALKQGKPDITMEIVSCVKNQNYMTVRNLKVAALVDAGRVDDAIPILKSIIAEDRADDIQHTFNRDVLDRVKAAILKSDNPDVTLEFNRLETLFQKQGYVSDLTLDEQLCSEIQNPKVNNRQQNRFSRYDSNKLRRNQQYNTFRSRPGLMDT